MKHFIRQTGFSLVELMLVLSVAALLGVVGMEQVKKGQEEAQASLAGQQIRIIALAIDDYVALRYMAIGTLTNAPGTVADPGPRTCSASICTIDLATLVNEGMLPPGYSSATTTNPFLSKYTIALHVGGVAPNYQIDGIVQTVNPWLNDILSPASASNKPRGDLLGLAEETAGPDAGQVLAAGTLTGMNGVWTETSSTFTGYFGQVGQLAMRAGYASSLWSAYLPRNGSLPMTGNLDMGGNSIGNATTVTATTSVSTPSLMTDSIAANTPGKTISAVGQNIEVNDIFLDSRSQWLSNLSPIYSSRGAWAVADGQMIAKPVCNIPTAASTMAPQIGVGKIIVTPATTSMGVQGTAQTAPPASYPSTSNLPVYGFAGDTQQFAYAVDNGVSWTVHSQTRDPQTSAIVASPGLVIAQVFCDFN